MKFLSFVTKYSRSVVILAIIAGALSGLCKALVIALVNHVLYLHNPADNRWLLVAFIAICLVEPLSRFIASGLLTYLGQKAVFDLRMRLTRQILATPLRSLEELGQARIMAVLTDDISTISNTLIAIPILCMQIAVVLGSLVYMAWLSPKTALLVFAFIIGGGTIFQLAIGKGFRFLKEAREQQDAMMKHFRSMLDGAKELKLHFQRRFAFLTQVFRPSAEAFRRSNLNGNLIYAATGSFGYQLIFYTLLGLLIFLMPSLTGVDTKTLTGFTLALFYMLIPLSDILVLFPSLARANIAMDKISSLGLSLPALASDEDAIPPATGVDLDQLELVGVTHSYHRDSDNKSFILGPIDFKIRQGELIFLVGGNGSGKTTLAKLLCGLYAPESGEIHLNKQPVTDENRDSYRQLFSVVFSDFYLFETLLGLTAQGVDGKAEAYIRQLQLHHKVQVHDGALSTIELSQGQRKRLALLTAFLEDRPFYIFDEWAADQDPFFRDIFYLQLLPELKAKGKTVLVISHDDRYYSLGDRIVKLDYGKIEFDSVVTHAEVREMNVAVASR
ncbi:MAG TPA: cyclic peptide export ABC transporter [Pyrinomonadaceae bacterium]